GRALPRPAGGAEARPADPADGQPVRLLQRADRLRRADEPPGAGARRLAARRRHHAAGPEVPPPAAVGVRVVLLVAAGGAAVDAGAARPRVEGAGPGALLRGRYPDAGVRPWRGGGGRCTSSRR